MKYLNITADDKLLIIAPHPDDECIGAGGLLSLFPKQCNVLILTDGRIGQSNYSPDEMIRVRKAELEEELNSIQVEHICYEIEDGMLSKNTNILDGFDFNKYTKIFVTSPRDGHPDHSASYYIVRNALKKQNVKVDVYLYEVHNPLVNPTHILDITKVISDKLSLIQYHKSQVEIVPYDRMANSLAEYRAIQNRRSSSYMEVFELDTEGYDFTITPLEIELQKQRLFYKVLVKWHEANHYGWDLGFELKQRGYRSIAIYGFAELGKLAALEIEHESEIKLSYIFDKRLSKELNIIPDKRMVYPDKYFEDVDCVIVSAVYYFEEIKKELTSMGYINVLSLFDIIKMHS